MARLASRAYWLLLAAAIAMVSACTASLGDKASPGAGKTAFDVFVGIAPMAYLVERLGGEHVRVHILLQPGQNEHTFSATPKQMLALGKTRLLIKAGLPFEDRLAERIAESHPGLRVVSADQGIRKRIASEVCHQEDHGAGQLHAPDDEHGHNGADPHVWLSPELLRIMASNIAEALEQADPSHAGQYRANLPLLLRDIDAAHAKILGLLRPYRGRTFYVFHPAFGYFADAYGLKQDAVETEGKAPTPKQLRLLIKQAKADGVKIIFVQPQFDQRSARTVAAAIDGVVLPLDPLAKDVLKNLENAAGSIAAAL